MASVDIKDLTCDYQETIRKVNEILACQHKWGDDIILTNPEIYTCVECGVHKRGKGSGKEERLFVDSCCIKDNYPWPEDGSIHIVTQKVESKLRKLKTTWTLDPSLNIKE